MPDGALGAAVIPRATYRLQLRPGFGLREVLPWVPYFDRLGVSHLYLSPIQCARAGSTHGYDVIDPNRIRPALGTREDLERLVQALRARDMGVLLDIVPNHMAIFGGDNVWWMDVLENGRSSAYAHFFDIDWTPADPSMHGRVLLPMLEDHGGVVLERGDLRLTLEAEAGTLAVHTPAGRLPLDPTTYADVLQQVLAAPAARRCTPGQRQALTQLIADVLAMPGRDVLDPEARMRRHRTQAEVKARLAALVSERGGWGPATAQTLGVINGTVGDPPSFSTLDALIGRQVWRAAHWQAAADEINYRRFFDVNELAALRMHDPTVFAATHRLVDDLLAHGLIDGLRVDHADGLQDPAAYAARLRRLGQTTGVSDPSATALPCPRRPPYVVLEKVLSPGESLPRDWPVHGTTGYDFAQQVTRVLVDHAARHRLQRTWQAFVGPAEADFETLARQCRLLVIDTALAAGLARLARRLLEIARAGRRTRDHTQRALERALARVLCSLPVYRTYAVEAPGAQDLRLIEQAVAQARRESPRAGAAVLDFVHQVLRGDLPDASAAQQAAARAFLQALQTYTPAVAAKGVEDTALYRHLRLTALNEVGGDPQGFGLRVSAFHRANRERRRHWPHTLLGATTHDSKRSADVRARLAVLSEMPALWRLTVRRWMRMNRRHHRSIPHGTLPTRHDEYLLYQHLLGTCPVPPPNPRELARWRDRMVDVTLKSAREAGLRTDWVCPDTEQESALRGFVQALLDPRAEPRFLDDLQSLADVVARAGALNSLVAATLHLTCPGVPDLFQGTETLCLHLVDPDNRRPVDFQSHARALDALQARLEAEGGIGDFSDHLVDGTAQRWLTWRLLALRRQRPELFLHGDYVALRVRGAAAPHVLAFARRHAGQVLLVVCGRLLVRLTRRPGQVPLPSDWADTTVELPARLAPHRLRPVLGPLDRCLPAGAVWPVGDVLAHAPVAVFHAAPADPDVC
ncbi:MAG: malto-oligosyltrehalose synthase [Rubrivivax sp.]